MFVGMLGLSWSMVACYQEFPSFPDAPVPSCPGVEPSDVDPEGRVAMAVDLGVIGPDPVTFCGAVADGYDDGWLFTLDRPSVAHLETPFCDCPRGDAVQFQVVAVDPPSQSPEANTLFTSDTLAALPDLPLGRGTWMLRMLDSRSTTLDYVGELSATPVSGRLLPRDAPGDLQGAPLVGDQLSGWVGFPVDVADVFLVNITEEEATLSFDEFTGELVTVNLLSDENGDLINNQLPLQVNRIDRAGQSVTYNVQPGLYWLELFGGPAVYAIDFEQGFDVGATF